MNYAVLCDLNALNISFATFEKAIGELNGKIVFGKFYGYNSKRNNDYTAYIKQHAFEVAVPLANRKKVRVDIRQVVDAVTLASSNNTVDSFFIICSTLDAMSMISQLKANGKRVVMGVTSPNFLSEQCDDVILLDRSEGVDRVEKSIDRVGTIVKIAPRLLTNSNVVMVNGTVEKSEEKAAEKAKEKSRVEFLEQAREIHKTEKAREIYKTEIAEEADEIEEDCNESNELHDDLAELQERVNNAKRVIKRLKVDGDSDRGMLEVAAGKHISAKKEIKTNGNTDSVEVPLGEKNVSENVGETVLQIVDKTASKNVGETVLQIVDKTASKNVGETILTSEDKIASINVDARLLHIEDKTVIESQDKFFLPYTDITPSAPQMAEIRKELSALIKEKRIEKAERDLEQKSIDIESLLEKYF